MTNILKQRLQADWSLRYLSLAYHTWFTVCIKSISEKSYMTTTGPSVLFMVLIYFKIYSAFTFWITEIEQVSRRWASSPWYWVRTWCRKGELPNTVTITKKSWRYFLSLVNYQLFVEPQSCGNHCWMTHKIKYRTHERKERDKNFVSMKTFVNEIMQHSEELTS